MRKLTVAAFRAWLEQFPPEHVVGVTGISDRCPLATYLTRGSRFYYSVYGRRTRVTMRTWYDQPNRIRYFINPAWADRFVGEIDLLPTSRVSAAQALKVLGEVGTCN